MRDVDDSVVDGATGMGMTDRRVLGRVELPTAIPLIGAGLRTTTVQVVATATLAALVGGGGSSRYVVDGFALQDITLMMSASSSCPSYRSEPRPSSLFCSGT